MGAGLVTIGRRQYAVGLYWENSPSGRISQAAKEAARQSSNPSDYYVTRSGNEQGRVPQFGLAPRNELFRAGQPSLAGCLANQQPGSWIGAFRFREGVALAIVRDDLIVPDGDLFFADEAEARDRLFEEMGIGGFQRIYAPEPWGVPNADTMPISLLLNDRSDIRLRSVTLSPRAKALIALGAGALILAAGIGWYMQEQEAARVEMERQRLVALEEARRRAQQLVPGIQTAPEYPPPEKKWEKRPEPLEVIQSCYRALEKVPVGVAGWRITGLRCDEAAMIVMWSREQGFSAPPPESSVSDNAGSAVSSVPVGPLDPRGEEALLDPKDVLRRYLAQNWPGSIRRIPDDPPPKPPAGYKGEWNPPPPPWVKRSFTLSVPVLPWVLPDYIGDIPGVVVNTLSMNGSGTGTNDSWTIEGVIYENRR